MSRARVDVWLSADYNNHIMIKIKKQTNLDLSVHVCCSPLRTRGEGSVHCDSGRSPTGTRSRCTRPPPTVRWSDTPSPGADTTPSILRKQKTKMKQKKQSWPSSSQQGTDGKRRVCTFAVEAAFPRMLHLFLSVGANCGRTLLNAALDVTPLGKQRNHH